MHNNNNGYPSNLAAWTTVAILMVAYVLSFIDRQILNLLVGPIHRDLAISDTEMSLLMGLSFALFYTLCGIPLGRMADNRSRRGLILFGVLVWSAMTAACGLARSYWQFLTFRVGVGVGEAALSPAAYSLIADSFPRERRATAISVYSMGIYLGSGLAFLLGGLVIKFASAQGDVHLPLFGEVRPWQLIFLILGAAGVLFCLLLLAIRGAGPARSRRRRGGAAGRGRRLPAGQPQDRALPQLRFRLPVLRRLRQRRLGADLLRPHPRLGRRSCRGGLRQHRRGVRLSRHRLRRAPGRLLGEARAQRREHARRAARRLGGDSLHPGLSAAGQRQLGGGADGADGVLPEHAVRRGPGGDPGDHAQLDARPGSAIYLFVVTLFGLGVGPTAVALVTDFVFADDMALRYSLLLVTLAAVLGAVVLLGIGLKPYRASLEHLKDWSLRREGEGGEDWKASRQPA